MDINSAFPSKYLKASDVPKPIKVVIHNVIMEEIEEGKRDKPVLYFQQTSTLPSHEQPAMVLNVTNANMVKSVYGSDTTDWAGKKIGLYVDPNIQFQGKMVPGLRIKVFQAEPTFDDPPIADGTSDDFQAGPPDVGGPPEDFDDDIPF